MLLILCEALKIAVRLRTPKHASERLPTEGRVVTCPSICSASFGASSTLQMCTPPWRPFLNLPRPRPPARIWLFTTTCEQWRPMSDDFPRLQVCHVVRRCLILQYTLFLSSRLAAVPLQHAGASGWSSNLSLVICHFLCCWEHFVQLENRNTGWNIDSIAAHQLCALQRAILLRKREYAINQRRNPKVGFQPSTRIPMISTSQTSSKRYNSRLLCLWGSECCVSCKGCIW